MLFLPRFLFGFAPSFLRLCSVSPPLSYTEQALGWISLFPREKMPIHRCTRSMKVYISRSMIWIRGTNLFPVGRKAEIKFLLSTKRLISSP
jgi:hypothetical protein